MKVAKLIHNPKAGDEEHSKKELTSLIESNGYRCIYSSVKKKGWKKIEPDVDFLIAAGGDGTIRRVVKELIKMKSPQSKLPIALLPLGTANNIAATLGVSGTSEQIVASWRKSKLKPYDLGQVDPLEDPPFFLESTGCGIFVTLLQEMEKQDKQSTDDPDLALRTALELLYEIVTVYEPRECFLELDEAKHKGKYLLVEIMNTKSIGPNLVLAPDADPGDSELSVVLIAEKHKERFVSYLKNKLAGKDDEFHYDTLKGKKIRIKWHADHIHVDGYVVESEKAKELKVDLLEGAVHFLVP